MSSTCEARFIARTLKSLLDRSKSEFSDFFVNYPTRRENSCVTCPRIETYNCHYVDVAADYPGKIGFCSLPERSAYRIIPCASYEVMSGLRLWSRCSCYALERVEEAKIGTVIIYDSIDDILISQVTLSCK